jgi:hypothetical protein
LNAHYAVAAKTFYQEDSLAMGIKDKSKSVNKNISNQEEERNQIILENIKDINEQAFKLAQNVMEHSNLRSVFADQVPPLIDSLLSLARQLDENNRGLYKENLDLISEALLDLQFTLADSPNISQRLRSVLENIKQKQQLRKEKFDNFPLPADVRNLSRTLKTDQINYQTAMSIEEIVAFYRQAFTQMGFTERTLVTMVTEEMASLAFDGLPNGKCIVLQAIDLAFSSEQDLRNVNLRTEVP